MHDGALADLRQAALPCGAALGGVAVIIIALFYSNGLDPQGFMIAGVGIAMVLFLQWIGIGAAYAFVIPGAVLWF